MGWRGNASEEHIHGRNYGEAFLQGQPIPRQRSSSLTRCVSKPNVRTRGMIKQSRVCRGESGRGRGQHRVQARYALEKAKSSMEKIKPISVERHLQEYQAMYFGSRGANPQAIASSIAEGALILGADRILIEEKGGWWYVCANLDWLEVPTVSEVSPETVFESVWAFPQEGRNWHRSEVMARVFSEATFTLKGSQISRVVGELPSDAEILAQASFLGQWERIVAFKFKSLPVPPAEHAPRNQGIKQHRHPL